MARLFVALDLPDAERGRLHAITRGLEGVRPTKPEQLHLTIRFIRETPPDQVAKIGAALAAVRVQPFEIALEGIGCFPSAKRARVLWAGLARAEGLTRLAEAVEAALVEVGVDREVRAFSPHVTLARFRRQPPPGLALFLEEHRSFRGEPFPVAGFKLFESHPSSGGYRHEVKNVFAFG